MNSYSFHINFYDLAFIGAVFTGWTFALQLWFTKAVNQGANRFLALALITMTLCMMRVLAIDISLETFLPGWDKLHMQFLLALSPLIYFYVLKITNPQYKFNWKGLLHFSPLLLEQTMLRFQQLNPLLQLLVFISVMTYLYLSHKRIQHFYCSCSFLLLSSLTSISLINSYAISTRSSPLL